VEEVEEETTWVVDSPALPAQPERKLPTCAACSRLIEGRCVTAMMRKFHPQHFVCSYCRTILNRGTFKERDDKPFCRECFYRLFG
jgi:paxillin